MVHVILSQVESNRTSTLSHVGVDNLNNIVCLLFCLILWICWDVESDQEWSKSEGEVKKLQS